jgi:hypothetical protein
MVRTPVGERFSHGYALPVGVGACAYAPWSLPVTVRDVQALRGVLTDPTLCGYPDEPIRLLCNEDATRKAILDGLAWLAERAAADGDAMALVYFSGHGWLGEVVGAHGRAPLRQGAGNRPGDAEVRVANLMAHLGRVVPASARALGAEQTPFLDAATEDFPVALVRGGKGLPASGWEAARDEAALRIGRVVQAIGDRSVAIGGDVSGSVIVTGDHALTLQ